MTFLTSHQQYSFTSALIRRPVQSVGVLALGLALLSNLLGASPAAAQQPSCPPINNLPAYPSATCVDYSVKRSGTRVETETSYITADAADTVRRFFERSFAGNGWTVAGTKHDIEDAEWEYFLVQGPRSVELEVEARDFDDGGGTEIDIDETAGAQPVTCPAVGGLPVYNPATCVAHTVEHDDGLTETESQYTTPHAADTVRRFFERSFAGNGWTLVRTKHDIADGEWEYILVQGPRYLEVEIEQKRSVTGNFTRITLAEQ